MRRSIYWIAASISVALAACSSPTAPTAGARTGRVAPMSRDVVPDTVPPPPDHGVTIGGSTH